MSERENIVFKVKNSRKTVKIMNIDNYYQKY